MPNYEINWRRLIKNFTPGVLRKPRFLDYVQSLISPVIGLHNQLLSLRGTMIDDLKITPSVRILRFNLNERFDVADRRITIRDGDNAQDVRIYTNDENQPVFLPLFLSAVAVDFEVRIPFSLMPIESQIRIFLDRYKLPTKRYQIIYF